MRLLSPLFPVDAYPEPAMIVLALLLAYFMPFGDADPLGHLCVVTGGNYTARSTYGANLELLSAALRKNASSAHFAKGSVGAAPDTVYGLGLCRGDASACGDCIGAAFRDAQQLCVMKKDARVLHETCVLRYSNHDFASCGNNVTESLLVVVWPDDVKAKPMLRPAPHPHRGNGESFASLSDMIDETATMAAYSLTAARYATGRINVNGTGASPAWIYSLAQCNPDLPPAWIYSLAQCNPDLPPDECRGCLDGIKNKSVETYSNSSSIVSTQDAWVVGVWCDFRYSTHQFYQGQTMYMKSIGSSGVGRKLRSTTTNTTTAPAPAPALVVLPSQIYKRRNLKILVNVIIVPLLATLFCFIVCFVLIRAHNREKAGPLDNPNINVNEDELVWGLEGKDLEFTFFDFSQVSKATSNFSDENKLGQGSFGPVYKDQFPDGREIAIKRLASHSGQGFTEFKNEVQLIAKLQYTNLVRLLGCCSQRREKLVIYEYLSNKSLDSFIFDDTKRALLNWNKRLAIIEGIAQGLLYLHKHSPLRVIHRDLKASNILLDNEMQPKISDFGLAKIFSSDDIEGNTTRIAGTYGYMAPGYASAGIFSIKSDVFSFGVLILEIISGKRNSGFNQQGSFFNLLGYAWKLWKEKRCLELLDASLVLDISASEIIRRVNIALICVQENADDRPAMSEVVAMLSSESMTLPEPNHPAYFHVRVSKGVASMVLEPSSSNDMTISVLCGR